jgi:DNA-binding transcriptional LysR family regulator
MAPDRRRRSSGDARAERALEANPDPRLLATFVVLAEERHFGRAARRLYLAQPAVTQRLQRLERQLGVTLAERTRHDVTLTPAGAAILPYARQAVAAAESVGRVAREAADGEPGTLRLGLSPGVHYLAERVLAELVAATPHVDVRAMADSTGVVAREVAAGRLDVAFGFSAAPTPGVRTEVVREEPAVLAVAPRHPVAERSRVALRELAGETFAQVEPAGGEGYNQAVLGICAQAGFEPRVVERPTGPMAWESAVRHHGCVGLTTRASAASTLRGIRVVELAEDVAFRLDLLWPETAAEPPQPAARFAAIARRVASITSPRP